MAINPVKTAVSKPAATPLPMPVASVSMAGDASALRSPQKQQGIGEEFDFFLAAETTSSQQKEPVRQNIDTMPKQSAPVEQAASTLVSPPAPVSFPVFVSDPAPASEPVLVPAAPPAAPAIAKSSPVSPNPLVEENLLILDVKSKKLGLDSSVLGYGTGETNFLPLGQLAEKLAFNLQVDAQRGKADGWFINEERKFRLDASQQTLTVDGKTYPWQNGKIYAGDDDIYLDSTLLSEIFPVNFNLSTAIMELNLDPREKLPLQLQYEREQRRKGLDGGEDMSLRYPLRKSEYDFFSFPRMDINTGTSFSAGNSSDFSLPINYSVQMSGDIAWMDADLFLSGNSENGTSSLRGSLSRYDIGGELFGPLQATKFSLGDISPASLSILPGGGMERGAIITNMPLDRSDSFDTTHFEGSLPSGWDVELYQSSSLIASQRVGADNRYSFRDISLHYGRNNFRLIGYGPQGQKRILKEQTLTVGSNMIKPGEFEYAFSASDAGRKLFSIGEENEKEEYSLSSRIAGKFSYGINKNLSFNGGISSVEFKNNRHNYLQTGFAGTLSSIYGRGDIIADSEGGSGISLQALTTINDINVRLRQDWYSGLEFEDKRSLKWRTVTELHGSTPKIGWLPSIGYNFELEESNSSGSRSRIAKNRLFTSLGKLNLSNFLQRNFNDSSIDGDARLEYWSEGNRIYADVQYNTGHENYVKNYQVGGDWWLDEDRHLSFGTDIFYQPGDDEKGSISMEINWDEGSFILTPSFSCDTGGNFKAGASLSFSLGRVPFTKDFSMASRGQVAEGGVAAFVYNDVNNNGIYDQGDTPIEDVEIANIQQRRNKKTEEEGVAFFPFLSPHEVTDVEIKSKTLADPAWQAPVKGVAIAPRPGHIERVEIPVVSTGELDGSIYVINDDGMPVEFGGLTLEMVDDSGEVQQTTVSEYDGFYLFDKIFPGEYILRIKEDGKEAAPHYEKRVTIGNSGDIISGNDIVLFNGRAYTPAPDLLEKGLAPPADPEALRFAAQVNAAVPEENAEKEEKPLPSPVPLRKKSANQLL